MYFGKIYPPSNLHSRTLQLGLGLDLQLWLGLGSGFELRIGLGLELYCGLTLSLNCPQLYPLFPILMSSGAGRT